MDLFSPTPSTDVCPGHLPSADEVHVLLVLHLANALPFFPRLARPSLSLSCIDVIFLFLRSIAPRSHHRGQGFRTTQSTQSTQAPPRTRFRAQKIQTAEAQAVTIPQDLECRVYIPKNQLDEQNVLTPQSGLNRLG